jgi:hypothetical protein
MFGDSNMFPVTLHFARIGIAKGTGIEQQL